MRRGKQQSFTRRMVAILETKPFGHKTRVYCNFGGKICLSYSRLISFNKINFNLKELAKYKNSDYRTICSDTHNIQFFVVVDNLNDEL